MNDSDFEKDENTVEAPSYFDNPEATLLFAADQISPPFRLAQYELIEEIGRGGMGVVFKARDRTGKVYAVKILKHLTFGAPEERQRFKKEAILHAQVESDFVVKHVEFASEHKIDFIVSEFVPGTNLQKLVPTVFKLGPAAALRIMRDVLRGLADIHKQSILHRDIKPGNIIVTLQNEAVSSRFLARQIEKSSLVDLGLARHVFQSESLALTQTKSIMGTPLYMAPEQSAQKTHIGPAADIYSVGCTLYHLLAGRPPFDSGIPSEVAEMHRNEAPENLTRLNSRVSPVLNDVVQRALSKSPEERYESGSAMLADVEALLNNQPVAHVAFPLTPTSNYKTYTFTRILSCTPEQLWPFVSETDRFNRAIGLPPPEFTFEGTGENRQRIARTRFNGLKISWREHPFEWILNQRMTVLREFESGPFRWVTNSVYLEPLSNNATRLIHEFQVEPRGWLGRMLTPIQFGMATPRDLDRVYTEIEKLALRNDLYSCDASFKSRKRPVAIAMDALNEAMRELIRLGHPKEVADRFSKYLCQSSDTSVSRIRPYALAVRLELSPVELLNICLDGSALNLLQLYWDIICPVCQLAANSIDSIKEFQSHVFCEVCERTFEADFAHSIEVVFSVHPAIRQVDRRTYCVGGPYHSPHVVAQIKAPQLQRESVRIPFDQGPYQARSQQFIETLRIESEEQSVHRSLDLKIPFSQAEIHRVSTGEVPCAIQNNSNQDLLIRIERSSKRNNVVTVSDLLGNLTFKKKFNSEFDTIDELVHPVFGWIAAVRINEFDQLVKSIGEANASRVWNDLKLTLDEVDPVWSVVSSTFDQFVIVHDDSEQAVAVIVENVEKFMRDKTSYSLCVSKDNFQVTGSLQSRRFFGKAIRDLTELSVSLDMGKIAIVESLLDEHIKNGFNNSLGGLETSNKNAEYCLLTPAQIIGE